MIAFVTLQQSAPSCGTEGMITPYHGTPVAQELRSHARGIPVLPSAAGHAGATINGPDCL